MNSAICLLDDKHVPLYRVIWISDVPHFCGAEDCTAEGRYEVRLEQQESIWANRDERDELLKSLECWSRGPEPDGEWNSD